MYAVNVYFRFFTLCKVAAADHLGVQPSYQVGAELQNVWGNIYPPVQQLCPIMERLDTNFCGHVRTSKEEIGHCTVETWEYKCIGHLFGVSITTVCQCVSSALLQRCCWHWNKFVSQTRSLKKWLPTLRRGGGSHSVLVLLMNHTYPSWYYRTTMGLFQL